MKNIYLIYSTLFFWTYSLTAQTPAPSPDFWEKVETNIYGNKSYVHKKLEEIQTPNASFAICDNGLMLLTFGTFTGTVNQHFVSSDDGKTWKVLIKSRYGAAPKYEPVSNVYSNENSFISENHGGEREDCVISSADGITWSKVDSRENYYRYNWLSNDDKIWKITTGSSQDIKHKFSEYFGKAIYYRAEGTIIVNGEIESAPWNNSKKVFQKKGAMASPSITIGQNGKIWKSCQGKYYYDNTPNGILFSEDDLNYKPFFTGLCEKGFSGYGDYGFQYENTNTPIFIYDKMFLNGWALNWKTTSRTSSLFFSEDSKNWKEIGLLINAENVRYNKKTKKFYIYLDGMGLFQSKKTYECGCQTLTPPKDPCASVSQKMNYHVEVDVVPQPSQMTCWAASAAMMHSYHNKKPFPYSISNALLEIEGKKGKFWKRFDERCDNCFDWQHVKLTDMGGISNGPTDNESKELFIDLMQLENPQIPFLQIDFANNLPILMLSLRNENQSKNCKHPYVHNIVVTGVYGDGTQNGTCVSYIDPWAWDLETGTIPKVVEEVTKPYNELFECKWDFAYYKGTTNTSSPKNESKKSVIQKNESYSNIGIENGNFIDNSEWTFSGGNVSFKGGKVSLQTEKKKVPVILKHQKFQVPNEANTLSFMYDKRKVGEAIFTVIFSSTEGSEEVYKEKISQSIAKINKGLGIANTILNGGELPPTENQEDKFETISVDISTFRGKVVELSFSYETLGGGKPKLVIDDVSIQ